MEAAGVKMAPALLESVRKYDKQADEQRDQIELWPDMAPAVLLFCGLATQWKHGPSGGLIGLDYSQIRPTADLFSLTIDAQAFHDIRTMEAEVLKVTRERAKTK